MSTQFEKSPGGWVCLNCLKPLCDHYGLDEMCPTPVEMASPLNKEMDKGLDEGPELDKQKADRARDIREAHLEELRNRHSDFKKNFEQEFPVEPLKPLEKFYITYGMGTQLKNCYSIIEAVDYMTARGIAHQGTDGGMYSFIYTEKEWYKKSAHNPFGEGQDVKYSLKLVPLEAMRYDRNS